MNYFQHFKADISEIELPEKFTFPFYYQAHPLAKIATNEIQEYLENQTDFKHNFGLTDTDPTLPIGKMFGVMVVRNKKNEKSENYKKNIVCCGFIFCHCFSWLKFF